MKSHSFISQDPQIKLQRLFFIFFIHTSTYTKLAWLFSSSSSSSSSPAMEDQAIPLMNPLLPSQVLKDQPPTSLHVDNLWSHGLDRMLHLYQPPTHRTPASNIGSSRHAPTNHLSRYLHPTHRSRSPIDCSISPSASAFTDREEPRFLIGEQGGLHPTTEGSDQLPDPDTGTAVLDVTFCSISPRAGKAEIMSRSLLN